MANEFITPAQMAKNLDAIVERNSGGDIRVKRAIYYDLQTSMGGFQSTRQERNHYIKTGKLLAVKAIANR